ncbi:MAG: restriction endonuclease subunit S [Bacteroidia bacterium]|nr:restriction endonuclease subunit S [Bacteroidia bacterium]
MNKNFSYIKASEYYSKITDGTHDSPKQQEIGRYLITSKHIKGRTIDFDTAYFISDADFKKINERSQVEQWDVIVSMIGEYCGFSYIERDAEINYAVKNVGIFKAETQIEAEWLYYYLSSPIGKQKLKQIKSGSSQPYLSLGGLRNLPILQPSNNTIKSNIVSLLSSFDSKIALNNRINAELEAMAKTVYDYWFVQFDFPTPSPSGRAGVGSPYKSSGGKMVWSEELKREVPEGWEVKKLKEIADTGSGGTPLSTEKAYYENGTIPWINSGEVNEPFIVSAKKYITQEGVDNSSAKLFNKGAILMAMYGATAGKVSIIDIEATTNQAVCGIMPKQEYFRAYLKFGLEDLYRYLINLSTGSARDNLSQDKIRELQFIIPDEPILKAFDKIADSAMSKILSNMKQNQQLSSLRDWLLPMLMNGQVRPMDIFE